jgi:hypothetical protein
MEKLEIGLTLPFRHYFLVQGPVRNTAKARQFSSIPGRGRIACLALCLVSGLPSDVSFLTCGPAGRVHMRPVNELALFRGQ